jgi:hypothetical protein
MAEQDANAVAITGGTINGATVGATTPAAGTFTTLTATGTSNFGTGSANFLQATGAASGAAPDLLAQGTDANIGIDLITKGIGSVRFNNAGGTVAEFNDGGAANPTNSFLFAAGGGGIRALIRAMGGPMTLLSTGANSVNFATNGSSGNIQAAVSHTASAVNYVQVTGAATGSGVAISAQGSDAAVGLFLSSKGAGNLNFQVAGALRQRINGADGTVDSGISASGGIAFKATPTGSQVNYFQAAGAITGFGPVLSAQGSDTNIPAVVQPKGTGALQAQQTDSTATGGNARGANAVDWQTSRGSASQVASQPFSVIAGGTTNQSTGYGATIVGGTSNTSSNNWSFVGAGVLNTASGQQSAVVNGASNTAAGFYNFIGGGFTNSGTASAAVTTQSGTMNGTTAVTLSGSNANIKVGQYITGTSIGGDTYVAAISGTSLTLSKVASGSSTSTLSFFTPHGVVVGGGNNQATGSYSFIGGGGDAGTAANRNVASGDWSVVVGGARNTASGISSFVGGGGSFGSGFSGNTASGTSSVVTGGFNNSAAGYGSAVLGGSSHSANSTFTTVLGGTGVTTRSIVGYMAASASNSPVSSTQGTSQFGWLLLGTETTNATATVLRSDTAAASGTNQVILPNNSAYYFRGTVVAGVTGGGNTKGWTIEGVIKRGANAASTALVGVTVASMYADAGAVTWTIGATADTTNGGLAITFTGQAATTIRCVAKIETTEMTY